jgi:hypothetical protein
MLSDAAFPTAADDWCLILRLRRLESVQGRDAPSPSPLLAAPPQDRGGSRSTDPGAAATNAALQTAAATLLAIVIERHMLRCDQALQFS